MREYLVIFETGDAPGVSAYVPDLPGCVAAGETRAEVAQLIREAIAFHIEGLMAEGDRVPPPSTSAEMIAA